MRRPPACTDIIRILRILFAFLSLVSFANATNFTPQQLSTALQNAGVLRVFKAETFETPTAQYLLVYGEITGGKTAIFIFRDDSLSSGHTGLKLDWQSGALPDELLVTAAGMPYVEVMDNRDSAILFSGCMPHNCPDKVGALVYSVGRRELFKATYDTSVTPHLKYSANALVEKNSSYKKLLDTILREHLVKTDSE
jgi:hypothetical protein